MVRPTISLRHVLNDRQVLALRLALGDCHQDGAAHQAFAGETHSRDLATWKAAGLPVEPGGRKTSDWLTTRLNEL